MAWASAYHSLWVAPVWRMASRQRMRRQRQRWVAPAAERLSATPAAVAVVAVAVVAPCTLPSEGEGEGAVGRGGLSIEWQSATAGRRDRVASLRHRCCTGTLACAHAHAETVA